MGDEETGKQEQIVFTPGDQPPPAPVVENKVAIKDQLYAGEDIERKIEDIVEQAEKRTDLVKKLKIAALKMTTAKDWVNQDDKPFLAVTGAEKVAPLFNVKIADSRRERTPATGFDEDDKGKFYRWWYFGTAQIISKEGLILYQIPEHIGSCSSRDKFFGKSGGEYKEIEEINEANICKKAYSDMVRNAITRILGLRSCSWEELETVGIKKDDVQSIKRGATVTPEDKKKQEELQEVIRQYIGTNHKDCLAELKKLAEFKDKDTGKIAKIVTGTDMIKGKWLNNVIRYAKTAKEKHDKAADEGTKEEDKK